MNKLAKKCSKDWWKTFFSQEIGDLMFQSPARRTVDEVKQVLKQSRIKAPARVLDLACGVGRHSLEFARKGHQVSGLDYARVYLKQARLASRKEGLQDLLRWVHGDMRDLRAHFEPESFDLVVSLFNSFGYFDRRQDDFRVLKEVARVLKPGGKFVLNTLNHGGVVHRIGKANELYGMPELNHWYLVRPGVFFMDRCVFDERKARTACEWFVLEPRKRRLDRYAFGQNVYRPQELDAWLARAGLKVERRWGRLWGTPFKASEWHQTVLATKP